LLKFVLVPLLFVLVLLALAAAFHCFHTPSSWEKSVLVLLVLAAAFGSWISLIQLLVLFYIVPLGKRKEKNCSTLKVEGISTVFAALAGFLFLLYQSPSKIKDSQVFCTLYIFILYIFYHLQQVYNTFSMPSSSQARGYMIN
jgi:hypothetical protein